MTRTQLLYDLKLAEETCWEMLGVFLRNRDAHGCHDMGIEIEALRRACAEIEKLDT